MLSDEIVDVYIVKIVSFVKELVCDINYVYIVMYGVGYEVLSKILVKVGLL